MSLSLKDSQTLSAFASFLYRFLPGSGFASVAERTGLQTYWTAGSKEPAILNLLSRTFEFQRGKFCDLMVELVRQSIAYGMRQGSPVTRENVIHLNEFVQKLNFKDPRLWDSDFLDSLPSSAKYSPKDNPNELRTARIVCPKSRLHRGTRTQPQLPWLPF